jgi:hypothetical protein
LKKTDKPETSFMTRHRSQGPTTFCTGLAISCIVLMSSPALAVSGSDEQTVEELMELSGLTEQIPRLPDEYMTLVDQLLAGLERQRRPASRTLRRQIRQSFVDALTPELLEAEIRSRLLKGLSPETTSAAMNWLRSDGGKKITTAEVNASSAESRLQFATFFLQLQLERPAPERLQLVRRIEEITQGSEMATEAWEAIVAAVARALESEYRAINPQSKKNLEESLASMRTSVKGMFEQGRLFQGLFTYRTLTDEELKAYAEFLESPAGRDVTHIVNRAVQGSAIDAIQGIKPPRSKSVRPPGETA